MGALQATMNVSIDACCEHTHVLADEEFHAWGSELFDGAAAYHIAVGPMVARRGPTFMAGLTPHGTATLLELNPLRSGVVILRYGFGAPFTGSWWNTSEIPMTCHSEGSSASR